MCRLFLSWLTSWKALLIISSNMKKVYAKVLWICLSHVLILWQFGRLVLPLCLVFHNLLPWKMMYKTCLLQELLVALKHVLGTDFKRGLFPLIDTLLDERYAFDTSTRLGNFDDSSFPLTIIRKQFYLLSLLRYLNLVHHVCTLSDKC